MVVVSISGLSIVICTRNRIPDLTRCIRSIGKQVRVHGIPIEVLIVDDGDIPDQVLAEYRSIIAALPMAVLHYYKKTEPGVWLSRYEAVGKSWHDIIVYFDDDVELDDPLYLRHLVDTYEHNNGIVGVGGIAKGLTAGTIGKLIGVLTCQMSASIGKLSASSLAGSLLRWHEARSTFETEFFHGCNMSFRRHALRDMKPYPWMTGYAVADDLYMCCLAGRYGSLVINPKLSIVHHESPRSRDQAGRVAKATAVNHYYLLRLNEARPFRFIALVWTLLYLSGKETLRRNYQAAAGYWDGIRFVLNPRKPEYAEFK